MTKRKDEAGDADCEKVRKDGKMQEKPTESARQR